MKKLKLLVTGLLVSLLVSSQYGGMINQVNIVNFTVKNTLPAVVDNWLSVPAATILTVQKVLTAQLKDPMMVLQIRSGSTIICGNTIATAKRIDQFEVRTFNTADLIGILSNCHELKAGTYSLCVQFYNIDRVAISREVCKDFRVEENNIDYAPPTLIMPEDEKKFSLAELMQPLQFRWTPLVPKPKEPVTYKLRVWQLMQGQNGVAAMKSNTPIVDKEIKEITQATVTGILTGPCKPPYLCDFIWNVQAVNREGKPMGRNNGMSESWSFGATSPTVDINPPRNVAPANSKQFSTEELQHDIKFQWTEVTPKQSAPVTYRLRVWQLMQGQNATQAMKSNNPVVQKDFINVTQATVTGILTGPCKPPYLCDFVWNVQALDREGKPLGGHEGKSEEWSFGATSPAVADINPPRNIVPVNNKQFSIEELQRDVKFQWTEVTPKQSAPVTYKLRVWQLMQGQNGTQAKSNKPIVEKDIKDATQTTVAGILTGPCKPPYLCDFIWNVQAIDREGKPLGTHDGTSEDWSFGATSPAVTEIKPPQNVLPENNKRFTIEEAKREVKFQWTEVTPKQSAPVIYKLRVWQLMQGQNGTQAMKSNRPIVEKEIKDATQATVQGILTGPCKPPYLCDFIWNVQATTREGKPLGSHEGTSEPTMFFASQYIIQLDSIKVLCTSKPGVYSFSYTISNVNPGTANLTNFTVTSSVPAGAALAAFAPPLGTSIASGNQLTITGTINAATNLSNICIGAEITDAANSFWKASKDTCTPVKPCKCEACDSVKIDIIPKGEIKLDTAGNIIQDQTITISPKPVKTVKAELVYYEYKPDSDDCMICNKDSKTYGNFISAATGLVSPLIPFGHTVLWTPNGQMVTNQALNFVISMPPTVKCCSAQVKWCIRYVVTFTDCTVCNKLVCYSYNKKCDCKQ